jgi:hypothetical protein
LTDFLQKSILRADSGERGSAQADRVESRERVRVKSTKPARVLSKKIEREVQLRARIEA